MEQSFTIPARPWTDADVAFLTRNAHLLDAETREELGLTRPEPINDFKADLDMAQDTPVVDTPVVDTPVVDTPVVDTPVVDTPVVDTSVVAGAGLPTDAEGAVVDNTTTDNA